MTELEKFKYLKQNATHLGELWKRGPENTEVSPVDAQYYIFLRLYAEKLLEAELRRSEEDTKG